MASAIGVLLTILSLFKVPQEVISSIDPTAAADQIVNAAQAVFYGLAIWGRFKADKVVK